MLLAGSPKLDRSKEDGAPHTGGRGPDAGTGGTAGHFIGWEPVNSRIITAKFITKKKDIKLNIIQCYAPTNDAEEEKKDDFTNNCRQLVIGGSIFPHKRIHKATWRSPDHVTENQIDHICIQPEVQEIVAGMCA
nr:hypothetical protein BaRGS_030489 [Batillaria attramentaria]